MGGGRVPCRRAWAGGGGGVRDTVRREDLDMVRECVKVGEVVEVRDWEAVMEVATLKVDCGEALRCREGDTLREGEAEEEKDLLLEGEIFEETLGVDVTLRVREVLLVKVPCAPQAVGKGFTVYP